MMQIFHLIKKNFGTWLILLLITLFIFVFYIINERWFTRQPADVIHSECTQIKSGELYNIFDHNKYSIYQCEKEDMYLIAPKELLNDN